MSKRAPARGRPARASRDRPDNVDPNTMLRLRISQRAKPSRMGSMTVTGCRRMAAYRRLTIYEIAGKHSPRSPTSRRLENACASQQTSKALTHKAKAALDVDHPDARRNHRHWLR